MRSNLIVGFAPRIACCTASDFSFYFASELAQLASGFTLLEGFKFAWVGLRRFSFADCVKLEEPFFLDL